MIARLTVLLALAVAGLLSAQGAFAQTATTIAVGDIYFCGPEFEGGVCETTIDAGDTVVWDFSSAAIIHTTTECGASCAAPTSSPLWSSGQISDGSTYSYTFGVPGTYLYFCRIHPKLQGGRIVVRAAPTATSPPAGPTPTFDPSAPTPTPGIVAPPGVGTGAGHGGGAGATVATLAAFGLVLVIAGTVLRRRSRTIDTT